MASEGEFPKGDGDILYASEANSFRNVVFSNIIYSVTPVVSGTWTTSPDDLENIYDSDITTASNYFEVSLSNNGYITWTLPRKYHINQIQMHATIAGDGGANYFKFQISSNGVDWTDVSDLTDDTSETTYSVTSDFTYPNGYCSYVRIWLHREAGGNAKAQIYDLVVLGV